jgi:hypothetical protein
MERDRVDIEPVRPCRHTMLQEDAIEHDRGASRKDLACINPDQGFEALVEGGTCGGEWSR